MTASLLSVAAQRAKGTKTSRRTTPRASVRHPTARRGRVGGGREEATTMVAANDCREIRTSAHAAKFQAMLARCNLLGSGRSDWHFVAKEASHPMAAPHVGDKGEGRADREVLERRVPQDCTALCIGKGSWSHPFCFGFGLGRVFEDLHVDERRSLAHRDVLKQILVREAEGHRILIHRSGGIRSHTTG